ncbi:hypothetical protein KEH57_04120 [Burkholderia cenocepacia]|uniref:Imm6 family immunity protein n=1 Tax=Burkholderia cenocepacia TaxID=95486 RepID=UPI001BA742A3|nr:Imm6 family immunity protein [Burkholderia cenocepacia]QUO26127.1 hypothetical protein KEH57_04120 [Burkholderia cenocepacia]
MLTDTAKILTNMSWQKRAEVLLTAAERANSTIEINHPESFDACRLALEKCKAWLNGVVTSPEVLAAYLDSDEAENPWMQESKFKNDSRGLSALIFITMVIGHIAYLAYEHEGKSKEMSETISEAGSTIFESMAEYGEPYGLSGLV